MAPVHDARMSPEFLTFSFRLGKNLGDDFGLQGAESDTQRDGVAGCSPGSYAV
jgi:hypothetical protein